MKGLYILAAIAAVVATANARATVKEVHPIDWYDCSGKKDGNYVHPSDCTRFVSCSGGIASERDCATCNYDPVRCPASRTVYNATIDACLWADETRCEVSENSTDRPITDRPTSTRGPIVEPPTSRPGKPGDSCDPDICQNTGYCQSYLRCNNGTLVEEDCGQDLVWNPLNSNGTKQIHGGNCDTWENLSSEVERRYRSDAECLRCFWKATGECESTYQYQAPDLRRRNVLTLSCSEGLVFSQEKETCQTCEDVSRANGSTCCASP